MNPWPEFPFADSLLPTLIGDIVAAEAQPVANGLRYALGQELTPSEPTPRDLVWNQGKIELWRFRSDEVKYGPPVLLMLGLASKSSLFDLYRGGSMAGYLVNAGFDVYMISWGVPGPAESENPVEYYTHRYLPRIIREVVRSSGAEGVTLLGYCMGGNFALIALASQPDLPVVNLVTIATPFDWDQMPEQMNPLRKPGFLVADHVDETGCIPPDTIVKFNQIRRPTADIVQMANVAERLGDVGYLAVHQAISRWGNDQIPFPRACAQQLVSHWLQENAFMNGTLRANGRPVDLKAITCPTLVVSAAKDEIVPAASANPAIDAIASKDKRLIELEAGHVGLTFGRSAGKLLHPQLAEWLREHSPKGGPGPSDREAVAEEPAANTTRGPGTRTQRGAGSARSRAGRAPAKATSSSGVATSTQTVPPAKPAPSTQRTAARQPGGGKS